MSRIFAMQEFYVREALPKFTCEISLKEKADRVGFENLRDGELLMLTTNLAEDKVKHILEKHTLSTFAALSYEQIVGQIGRSKARQWSAALELFRRAFKKGCGVLPAISCPTDAIPFLASIKDEKKENFLCLFLNARNQVIHSEIISVGSLSASIVHPREIFCVAINHLAASIILAHNHPSQLVDPSKDDIELTRRLVKAGEILGVEILDHLIISSNDFLSLKERGLM